MYGYAHKSDTSETRIPFFFVYRSFMTTKMHQEIESRLLGYPRECVFFVAIWGIQKTLCVSRPNKNNHFCAIRFAYIKNNEML